MPQESSIEIQADSVSKTACPKCGSVVDAGGAPPFSILQCAKCEVKFAAPGKLGGFILLKELGRGQMGVTYKAFEKVLGRYVAIKVMRASLGSDPKRVKDFMAEGRALASLDHPNAVRIFSIGQEKGQPYIVMELVNGKSVGHLMGQQNKLSEPRALEIATGVARALRAASEIGLIHSDVKPDNIVLDEKGRAKLVDFGIARFGPGKLEADAAIGTPYYVAPEQVLRASVDRRTDIYSLGATLFHALAGVPPFPGTELKAVLHARLKKPAPSVMKVCRGLHLETVQVVSKMLERDPDQRYQSYDELLKDLRRACWAAGAELTQDADDIPINVAAPSPEKSSMGKLVFVLMLLLAGAGAVAWAMWGKRQSDPGSDSTISSPVGQVAAPVFSPWGRKIAGPTEVRASCDTPKADIRYTTDGTEPTPRSRRWSGAIKILPKTTLRARAFHKGLKPSEIVEAEYERDSVVLQDVVEIRSEAEAAWKGAQDYDLGQGFEAKVEQCKKLFDQATELYKKDAYAAAKTPYKRVVFLCKELKTLDGTRKTARGARDRAQAAIRSVPDFGTVDKPNGAWKPVAATARKALTTFDRGEFVKAYGLWGQVVGQIEHRYKAMLPNVRKDYENALKSHDPKLLKDHGGQAWKSVEVAAHQASQAGTAGRFAQAVALYRKAMDLLGPAVRTAKTASTGAKTKAAIASVNGLIGKGLYYKARDELSKIAPGDPTLLKFKATINAALEMKIYLKPGATPEKGGLIMPLRRIEPGRFQMGSAKSEPGRDKNETPHAVEITQPFYIGKYEVTRRQFEHFAKSAGYKTAPEDKKKKIWSTALVRGKLVKVAGASWKKPGFVQGHDHPVVCVSWEDAMAFCRWLSGQAKNMTVTLPTEAQWEYACRQETKTRFSFGDDDTKLHIYGNYADGSSDFASGNVRHSDGNAATSPVGSFKTTHKFARLYDMHGNAAEWCSDWFGLYPQGADGKVVKDPGGILRGVQRVVRGGSWASAPAKCRSAARGRMAAIAHSAIIGFRVAAIGKAPTAAVAAGTAKAAVARRNAAKTLIGRVGVGTWDTSAEFKDLTVNRDGKRVFSLKNVKQPRQKFKELIGKWTFVRGGLMRQTDLGRARFATFGDVNWSNYTLHVKARKISGKEGFMVRFADDGKGRFYYFNLGGKVNTKHMIERYDPGQSAKFLVEIDGKITDTNWHDVRVELAGSVIRGFLDNKLIHTLDVATGSTSPIGRNPTPPAAGTDLLPDFCKKFTITAWVATKDKGTIFAKTALKGKWVRGGKSLYIGEDGHVYYEIKDGGKLRGDMKVADGKWHHVVLLSEGRRHKIFVDGKPKGEADLNTAVGDPKGSIGKIGFTATDFPKTSGYKGLLDEVCVYDRALSPKELTATATARKLRAGLVGYWKFESGGRDDSGKGNHAKGTGVAYHLAGRFGKALKLLGKGALILRRGK